MVGKVRRVLEPRSHGHESHPSRRKYLPQVLPATGTVTFGGLDSTYGFGGGGYSQTTAFISQNLLGLSRRQGHPSGSFAPGLTLLSGLSFSVTLIPQTRDFGSARWTCISRGCSGRSPWGMKRGWPPAIQSWRKASHGEAPYFTGRLLQHLRAVTPYCAAPRRRTKKSTLPDPSRHGTPPPGCASRMFCKHAQQLAVTRQSSEERDHDKRGDIPAGPRPEPGHEYNLSAQRRLTASNVNRVTLSPLRTTVKRRRGVGGRTEGLCPRPRNCRTPIRHRQDSRAAGAARRPLTLTRSGPRASPRRKGHVWCVWAGSPGPRTLPPATLSAECCSWDHRPRFRVLPRPSGVAERSGTPANHVGHGSRPRSGGFHVAVSRSNPKQIRSEIPAFPNCTLGSRGQLEALELISRVELGERPHQKTLSSPFHLAGLLGDGWGCSGTGGAGGCSDGGARLRALAEPLEGFLKYSGFSRGQIILLKYVPSLYPDSRACHGKFSPYASRLFLLNVLKCHLVRDI